MGNQATKPAQARLDLTGPQLLPGTGNVRFTPGADNPLNDVVRATVDTTVHFGFVLDEAVAERESTTIEGAYAGWEAQIPMGRLADPPELGAVAAFLCSEKASYVTGQSIVVDGGWVNGLF